MRNKQTDILNRGESLELIPRWSLLVNFTEPFGHNEPGCWCLLADWWALCCRAPCRSAWHCWISQSPWTNRRCTTSPSMTCASVWMRDRGQNISIGTNDRVPVWGQNPQTNIGTLMDSALVFNHFYDSQPWCQQRLPSFTTKWQFAQIQNLRSYIDFHFTLLRWNLQDATYLHGLLTCPKYPMYQSAAGPFHKLSRNYIATVLPERFFTRCDGCTKKDMKLFHKFIDSCGLFHVHSTREKQSSNRKCRFS
jgi:hypothetical protein